VVRPVSSPSTPVYCSAVVRGMAAIHSITSTFRAPNQIVIRDYHIMPVCFLCLQTTLGPVVSGATEDSGGPCRPPTPHAGFLSAYFTTRGRVSLDALLTLPMTCPSAIHYPAHSREYTFQTGQSPLSSCHILFLFRSKTPTWTKLVDALRQYKLFPLQFLRPPPPLQAAHPLAAAEAVISATSGFTWAQM
jgi:hypothetical protein